MKSGINISKHNGITDQQKVKVSSKVNFAILRVGYDKSILQKDV